MRNAQAVRQWLARGGPQKKLPLDVVARHEFQLLERTAQPSLPGPLSDDFAVWQPVAPPPEHPVGAMRSLDPRKLRVLTV
jgi:hypothetical protein